MTLPQYYELSAYWARHPPIQRMVQAALDIKGADGPAKAGAASAQAHTIADLKAMFPAGVMKG